MSTISSKGVRSAIKPSISTNGIVFDKSVNIEPVKVELVTEIKESQNLKLLGAVLLFPQAAKVIKMVKTVKNNEIVEESIETLEDRKYWVSFDHLLVNSKDLFSKFYDNTSCTFINACKVGVRNGQVYLAAA